MRDALRTDDQESYFRILSGVDLLLPVSADALAGLAPLGWGTWSTGGRTHVLAFTSTAALQACLSDYTGSARRVPYGELANTWPNLEWWLAVNPGLPVEGYLPAWFVAQLSRGDLRLPTRGPGREPSKIQDLHAAALAHNAAAAHDDAPGAQTPAPAAVSGAAPGYGQAAYGQPGGAAAYGQSPASAYGQAAGAPAAGATPAVAAGQGQPAAAAGYGQSGQAGYAQSLGGVAASFGQSSAAGQPVSGAAYGQPVSGAAPYGQTTSSAAPYGQPTSSAAPYGQPTSGAAPYGQPTSGVAAYGQPATSGQPVSGAAPAAYGQPGRPSLGGAAAAFSRSAGQAQAGGGAAAAFGGPAGGPGSAGQQGGNPPAAYGQPGAYGPADGAPASYAQPGSPAGPGYGQSDSPAAPGYDQSGSPATPGYAQSSNPAAPGYGQSGSPAAPGYGQSGSPAAPGYGQSGSPATPPYGQQPGSAPTSHPGSSAVPAAYSQSTVPPSYGQDGPGQGGPGQSGPGQSGPGQSHPGARLGGAFAPPPGAGSPPAYGPPTRPTSVAPAGAISPGGNQPSAAYAPPAPPASAKPEVGPGGLPIRSPGAVNPTSGLPTRTPPSGAPGNTAAAAFSGGPAGGASTNPYRPSASPPQGRGWDGESDPRAARPELGAPLPVRTPMAQTPPVPENFAPHNPDETPFEPRWPGLGAAPAAGRDLPRRNLQPPAGNVAAEPSGGAGFPQGPASPQAAAAWRGPEQPAEQRGAVDPRLAAQPGNDPQTPPAPGFGSPLPRRQAGTPSSPTDMSSFPAFQTPAERAARPASAGPMNTAPAAALPARPGVVPPVIPGAVGSDRPARFAEARPLEVRAAAPIAPPERRPAPAPATPAEEPFIPANEVERDLHDAADAGNTDRFLSTLLLATVLVPVAHHSRPGSAPGESGFAFRTEQMDDEQYLIVFTSRDRLSEHFAEPTRTVGVRFYELIRNWPDPTWSFAVNPGGPIGAKYPGPQVIALASWATEAGLGAEPEGPVLAEPAVPVPAPEPASDDAQHATVMQKTIPPDQVDYYLERGYDRVAGFVHRATEVEHLRSPGELFGALGLTYDTSPHLPDAKEAFVLRWPAYRPSLYRIPYGGQNEQALRAMDGWVIERAPFRGNGFAPGESRDVVAEFKVDSVRLPHGAQLWRLDADGNERMVAIFDNDGPTWRRVGEQ